jgi:thermitase
VDEDPNGNEIAAGELIVTYEDKLITSQAAEDTPQEVEAEIEEELPEIQAQLLSFPDVKNEQDQEAREQTLEEKKETIETDPNVEAVDYNYIVKALGQQYQALMTPNDQYYNLQWGYPKIKAPEAWDVTQGSNQTKVAVVDTGVQAGHPDLQGKVVGQKDFVDNDDTANDGTGHGTHVAGTVGAVTNNTTGVAGTCPSCSILAARVLDSTGVGSTFSVVQGINWSRTNGAKVINLSLGAPVPSPTVLENAVNNAWNAGLVVVAGAGNSGDNATHYPGAYTNSIAVAATDQNDKRAIFSTYGDWVDVAAPGVRIYSTVPSGLYGNKQGTSMANPHVAGLAGLLASQGKTNSQTRNAIETTTVDLGTSGKDQFYGNGRINAQAAVGSSTPPPPPPDPPPGDGDGQNKNRIKNRIENHQNRLAHYKRKLRHTYYKSHRHTVMQHIDRLEDQIKKLKMRQASQD